MADIGALVTNAQTLCASDAGLAELQTILDANKDGLAARGDACLAALESGALRPDAHALECYVAARAKYASLCRIASGGAASCGWPRIDEHIEHALGRQCGDRAIKDGRATRAIARRR